MSVESIQAVILAGGLGTRLRTVVADRPKVLAEVAGRPFLAHLFDQLSAAGFRSVVVCVGYQADAVMTQFGEGYGNLCLHYSIERSPLGTGGALRNAIPYLQSDPVLVLNGDSYCAKDLAAFAAWHRRVGASASLALAEVLDSSRYGRVSVDGEGSILGFVEKAAGGGPGWINAGVYLLSQQFLRSLPAASPLSLEREVFPNCVGQGLFGHCSRGRFIDIGTPESYALAGQVLSPARVS